MTTINTIELNNGIKMPQEGFGVFQIPDYEQCKQAVKDALSVGYRSIDTAQAYQNEQAVGDAIKESGINRDDIFITTKVWISNYGDQKTIDSIHESLKQLETDYIDLVLLHQPFGDYYGAYRALESLYKQGIIKAIGVSNFSPDRYLDLVINNKITPAVNQLETHVFYQQNKAEKLLLEHGTQLESWGPLAEGKNNFFTNETLEKIGQKYQKSVAQVALRFLVQHGAIIIPKSTHIERMKENIEIWDFELTTSEMDQITSLDLNHSLFLDHTNPESVKNLNNLKI